MINQKVGLLNTIYTLALFALNAKGKELPKEFIFAHNFSKHSFWDSANIYMGPTFLSVT